MYTVDINCDMGESFGSYKLGRDEEILDYVTSANIACGFHAGDPSTMKRTVQMALEKNVGIGAHPGVQDLVGFGRREINLSPEEAYDIVVYQIGALYAFVKSEGGKIQHVKPHGALFNMAAKDAQLAEAIAEAVYKVDPEMILFGLAGSELVKAGKKIGLRTANEVFSDRTYQQDGSLTSRREKNALITDHTIAVQQVIRMVKEGKVQSLQGVDVAIQADTICIHGDGINALDFAKYITKSLEDADIKVTKISNFLN
ncbi:LamB/YcsF family protein [Caldibacillus thermolactis]|jgi:5-oxoprolinase (ATP-hydrolysing) subunit A|uniref:5-oxoprolinase subunit A n=1 Tax=Pallidibacillus thermolactis TaxID=251051 RepID=A0ABT2WH36_9BACI|nr:5-oxoprolinase subunit PxpA [Pallidibacillus thermolactis]MCU9593372.1 LamB/YcsF family protein [Pallidibacillus thermolactis]MCU9601513.1 LamB/YcsF family protein [Pallidibacillus thermolactis subsp. kokeshiiformis]MED1672635.1 LamB/YcsF family protein [Pallidibacillus thermolactis subsp. kokeshiiformis]